MRLSSREKELNAQHNAEEYGNSYQSIPFVDPIKAGSLLDERDHLLNWLSTNGVELGYNDTKLDCRELSPGCRYCAEGLWSCLFINGICNAKCAYCPTAQDDRGTPTTSTLPFPIPEEYVDYLKRYGFKGVSFSGGEPLLTFETTLSYVRAVRQGIPDSYIWLYTNGILASREKFELLRDAGLNEIRFDIGATGYKLDGLKLAMGVIPVVTVEIPALSDHFEQMKRLLPDLSLLGVNHLNLHQLRLTPHNLKRLAGKPYTFLHGPKVTCLDSELTALRLIQYSLQQGVGIPINYCSFPFKNRFQGKATRTRSSREIVKPYEDITDNGFIRSLFLHGDAVELQSLHSALRGKGVDPALYSLQDSGRRLHFSLSALPHIHHERFSLGVSYYNTAFAPRLTYRNPFVEIRLRGKRKIVVERMGALVNHIFPPDQKHEYMQMLTMRGVTKECFARELAEKHPETNLWARVLGYEVLMHGLPEYY
jgi:pyruvate formate-lyase activating enzyme-like uncharacterized protein